MSWRPIAELRNLQVQNAATPRHLWLLWETRWLNSDMWLLWWFRKGVENRHDERGWVCFRVGSVESFRPWNVR